MLIAARDSNSIFFSNFNAFRGGGGDQYRVSKKQTFILLSTSASAIPSKGNASLFPFTAATFSSYNKEKDCYLLRGEQRTNKHSKLTSLIK